MLTDSDGLPVVSMAGRTMARKVRSNPRRLGDAARRRIRFRERREMPLAGRGNYIMTRSNQYVKGEVNGSFSVVTNFVFVILQEIGKQKYCLGSYFRGP
jgi:hypothetical protein